MQGFNYQNAQFDYEPYPVCYIPNFLSEADYKELAETYPSVDVFKHKPLLGNKYSLAEKNNKQFYFDFLKENPAWKEFYNKVKTKEFVLEVVDFVKQHHIDLGVKRSFWYTKKMEMAKRGPIPSLIHKRVVRSRFEFSAMGANGGNILPHSDHPRKLITLVLSFMKPGEWNEAWGGGTDVLLPKDRRLVYNEMNRQMPFDQMDVIKTFPFNPNQCVLFIKTFNSWHSVQPMKGPESALRKTVTINIENIP
jgi:hypothetical protein